MQILEKNMETAVKVLRLRASVYYPHSHEMECGIITWLFKVQKQAALFVGRPHKKNSTYP